MSVENDMLLRALSDEAAKQLYPGQAHYKSFVGPPLQYDLMGATQFALLLTLGLRDYHRLLDFGCGSLRAGRLLIPYLDRGNYCGLDPNSWLIQDGLERQLGSGICATKWPHFYYFDDFQADRCGTEFDFILAQSIFSHAGVDLMTLALASFRRALRHDGLIALTVIHSDRTGGVEDNSPGWTYPECVSYAPETITKIIREANLIGRAIPWFHPRQTWYLLARDPERLPDEKYDTHLRGVIFNEPEWEGSFGNSKANV